MGTIIGAGAVILACLVFGMLPEVETTSGRALFALTGAIFAGIGLATIAYA